ncbi:pYEATS domain-containing protein [Winogradskyella sp. 3972H.M.0a.05]|uniref:pYEATS domain-containing protein n=1 Tax=Winogradskyella sp. 3972H.M.0a.05 TaxID=2950277 RepID=UPI003393F8C8
MNNYKLITILNTKFKPIHFRLSGKAHYQIFLSIESTGNNSLNDVKRVEYYLHPSFKKRLRSSVNRSNNFRIEIKAWGVFDVKVTIFKNDGTKEEFTQSMKENFKREAII